MYPVNTSTHNMDILNVKTCLPPHLHIYRLKRLLDNYQLHAPQNGVCVCGGGEEERRHFHDCSCKHEQHFLC
jgi:hypothetical protein